VIGEMGERKQLLVSAWLTGLRSARTRRAYAGDVVAWLGWLSERETDALAGPHWVGNCDPDERIVSDQLGDSGALLRGGEMSVVSHAAGTPGNVKWYESSFASAALGIVALIILVVFLVLVFRQNPSALIKVLGAVAALETALAGLVWALGRGANRSLRISSLTCKQRRQR
jgi:hypothetical protein